MKYASEHRIGVIPFECDDDGTVRILFISSSTRGRWVLPKGRRERGESHIQTCRREAHEEAGVDGLVIVDYPMTALITKAIDETKTTLLPVTYYPFRVKKLQKHWPEESWRERSWVALEDVRAVVEGADIIAIIDQFEQLLPWIREILKR